MSKGKRDAPSAPDAPRALGAPDPPDVGSDDQVQKTLDDALADSFPASDPVSIVTSQHEEAWQKADEYGEKRDNCGKREHAGRPEHQDNGETPEAGSRRR